jgi:uncharacterized BrkB/YihY/UPF0761 family membrane protein
LLWLLISFAVVIIGAEINATLKKQTGTEPTGGPTEGAQTLSTTWVRR